MKMNINPDLKIKIKISDPGQYTQSALLVDRPDYLDDVVRFRQRWEIDELSSYLEDDALFNLLSKNRLTHYYPSDAKEKWEEIVEKHDDHKKAVEKYNAYIWEQVKPDHILNDAYQIALTLADKYQKPREFQQLILKSIVCGEIRDSDYRTCDMWYSQNGSRSLPDNLYYNSKPVITLSMHPITTKREMLELYDHKMNHLVQVYVDRKQTSSLFDPDTISSVKQYRKWHWLRLAGKTYPKIFELVKDEEGWLNDQVKIKEKHMYKKVKFYRDKLRIPLLSQK